SAMADLLAVDVAQARGSDDLAQPAQRAREARLHRAAGTTQRTGHLAFGQLEEIAVRHDQAVFVAQTVDRPQQALATLVEPRVHFGRWGRTSSAFLGRRAQREIAAPTAGAALVL